MYYLKVYEVFRKAHAKWEINFIFQGYGNSAARAQAMIAAGQVPTVVSGSADIPYQFQGQLYPLDEVLQTQAWGSDEVWKDTFMEQLWPLFTLGGHIIAIPSTPSVTALWYDENQFDGWGLNPPKTWGELLSLCETIKGRGVRAHSA